MVETDNGVANKEARSLGSTVLVDACGAFVAVLRNRPKILRARADGEFPNSAACPFPVGPHSFGRCSSRWCSSVEGRCACSDGRRRPFRSCARAARQAIVGFGALQGAPELRQTLRRLQALAMNA